MCAEGGLGQSGIVVLLCLLSCTEDAEMSDTYMQSNNEMHGLELEALS